VILHSLHIQTELEGYSVASVAL